jgi:hypothetical protein
MRLTLLAVGIALLVSMLFAPHTHSSFAWGGVWHPPRYEEVREKVTDLDISLHRATAEEFLDGYKTVKHKVADGYWEGVRIYWYWWPIFYDDARDVRWRSFWGQTAFIAILAAVVVNLRKSWRRKRKSPVA